MSTSNGNNGHGGHGVISAPWASESPFAAENLFPGEDTIAAATSPAVAFNAQPQMEMETPFATEYFEASGEDERADQYSTLLNELYSEEFNEAVADLTHEASAFIQRQFPWQGEDPVADRAEAERALRDYFAPLDREANAVIDRLAGEATAANLNTLTETEVDSFLERFQAEAPALEPPMQQFFKKFVQKAKGAIKGAVKIAKKVKGFVEKISPLHIVMNKIKGLIRPMIERILKSAIDKLPAAVRPIAKQLADKMFGAAKNALADESFGMESETEEEEESVAATTDLGEIQAEMDAEIAGTLVAGEEFERRLAIERATRGIDPQRVLAYRNIVRARRRFADRILSMKQGEDPAAAAEEFAPALIQAAKIGVQLIGRERVAKMIGKLVSPLLAKFIPKAQAAALAPALVDSGLKLMGFELTQEEEERAAADALVATVESTAQRAMNELPVSAWESEESFEAWARPIRDEQAAALLPDREIRADLHESATLAGQWISMPVKAKDKVYLKYTRIPQVVVTPQKADSIRSFGGESLGKILRDQLGVPANKTVKARVHLYQAMTGTWLSKISELETDVPGLGTQKREAWSLIHPLTAAAAGLLLGEPKLGKDSDAEFLEDRDKIDPAGRFYYLEIVGAAVRVPPSGRGNVSTATGTTGSHRPAHTSQGSLVIDTVGKEIRLHLSYSEADAQAIAATLRQQSKPKPATILAAIRSLLTPQLEIAFGRPGQSVRIVGGNIPGRGKKLSRIIAMLKEPITKRLTDWLMTAFRKELDERLEPWSQKFVSAADAADDGATVIVTISAPETLDALKKMFSGKIALLGIPGLLRNVNFRAAKFDVRAGFVAAR